MAYDRYDRDRGRDDPRRSDHGDRSRREERGFFERAGDEISSWFGGDDDDRGRRGERGDRGERGRGWSAAEHGWGGDPERAGYYNRDRGESRGSGRSRDDSDWSDRGSGRPMNWTTSNSDYRSGSNRSGESWFGDDDRDQGRREGGWLGGGGDRDRDRDRDRERGYRPMAGDYGRSDDDYSRSDSAWGRDDYRRTSYAGSNRDNDRHYNAWRQRQLDELDRDYDEYHRERQEHFENDFGSWRETRQQKRQMVSQAREHMDVVGSDGETIGKVDRIAGDRIVLTKSDSPDGRHHSIPCSMVDKVEDDRVVLDCKAEEAQKKWRDDDRERALFERDDQGESGPHMLERSFSGTYKR